MPSFEDVLSEVMPGKHGNLGILTLNRPNVLNSLNHEMINFIHAQLVKWKSVADIKAVIIRAAEGRAFCAGGDLRSTYHLFDTDKSLLQQFFYDEYQLNRCIYHYPKPFIAILDGITMGGGAGISIHGSHRIATERLLFAMPETGIGFFPDIGGTYFLPRLPGKLGYYLGLIGARINSDDCTALGITQCKIEVTAVTEFILTLVNEDLGLNPKEAVSQLLRHFSLPVKSPLMTTSTELDNCFAADSIESIIDCLAQSAEPLCQEAYHAILKKSPTSLKVTLQALMQGSLLDFDACMQQEYRLTSHFILGHDFREGIRAVIIDKDQSPVWQPASLNGVYEKDVQNYFTPIERELIS
jgi:enoyl-CoA hydratase